MIENDILCILGYIIYGFIGLYLIVPIAITMAVCEQIKNTILLFGLGVIVILIWVCIGYEVCGDKLL